jgi:NAD(P)-dependent dehydrogenase (short-subunit alcohol dehydrogenase family)
LLRLEDKVAIVTGGGRGIGKAIALAFAAEGAAVVVAARSLSKLKEVIAEIQSKDGRGKAIQTDVTDEKQVQHMVEHTIKEYGHIDVLVNNSGIGGPTAKVVDLKLEDWNEVIAVDLTGSMLCAREVLRHMIPRRSGNIINMAAEGGRGGDGRSGYPMRSPYCCAKMGIIGLTETLAIEVGEYNIRVNCISPAAVRGKRFNNVVAARSKATGIPVEDFIRQVTINYSLKRPAEESEIAATAVFLASDESNCITGQTIITNCGLHVIF